MKQTIYNPKLLDNVRGTKTFESIAVKMGVSTVTVRNWKKDISKMRLVDYVKLLHIMEKKDEEKNVQAREFRDYKELKSFIDKHIEKQGLEARLLVPDDWDWYDISVLAYKFINRNNGVKTASIKEFYVFMTKQDVIEKINEDINQNNKKND